TGSYTAANSAYNYSATKTNVYTIAALGHSYGAGAWSWEDDGHSATCTRTCSHDANHTSSKSVTLGNGITSELTEAATCSKKGSHTYTATTTVENVEYSDSKEVADIDIDPLNHNYGAGVWSWNNDGHSATCTRTCSYDANHTSSASVTLGNGIESAQQVAPTCTTQGTTRYTAMTTVEGAQYSDTKDVDDIAATGLHTFDDETDPHHTLCTVCDHSFFRYTSSTNKAVAPYDASELKDAKNQKLTIISNTYADGKGVIEFNKPLVTIGQNAFWNCKDFKGDLTIPNTVTNIGIGAFQVCKYFDGTLTIPSSVKSIARYAFADLGRLQAVKMASIPQVENETVFAAVNCTKTVTLSDDSYVYTGDNPRFPAVQSASYTRRGIKNQWGTLVVPFDVNGSGADYDLYTLFAMDDYNLTLIKFDGTLPAGTPVIFRLHDDLAGNYNLTLTASNTTVSGQFNEGSEANGLQLVGTYETTELDINDYFISNNQFWRVYDAWAAAWGVKVAPFRAYLKSTWAGAKASSLSIRIADEDDDVTAVETLNAITDGTAEYYDMNGRRINSLQKGVNIVKYGNGKTKKVTIK
ncbi:MAG: leucine-rich repeat domain-containing protein, partial [Bacteroidaceae bacterium]|nr:leucine-rich repeat domain-containing protein [Bacteroidaceae bacterium]